MSDPTAITIFPLYGAPCHLCARPAQWFVEGATLPCKCGLLSVEDLAHVVELVRRYPQIKAAADARAELHRQSAKRFGAKLTLSRGRPRKPRTKTSGLPISRKRAA